MRPLPSSPEQIAWLHWRAYWKRNQGFDPSSAMLIAMLEYRYHPAGVRLNSPETRFGHRLGMWVIHNGAFRAAYRNLQSNLVG